MRFLANKYVGADTSCIYITAVVNSTLELHRFVITAFMSEVEYGNIPPLVSIAAASVQAYRTDHGFRFYIYTAPRLDAPVRAQLIAHSCYGNEGSALWHLFVDMHTASASSSSRGGGSAQLLFQFWR